MHLHTRAMVSCVTLATLTVGTAFADDDSPNVTSESLLNDLKGVWVLESVEMAGIKRTGDELPERFRGMRQSIDGPRMTVMRTDGKEYKCKLTVKVTGEPYHLDIKTIDSQGQSRTARCIYKIEDGKLIVAESRTVRPSTFETTAETRTKVSTFQRKHRAQ